MKNEGSGWQSVADCLTYIGRKMANIEHAQGESAQISGSMALWSWFSDVSPGLLSDQLSG